MLAVATTSFTRIIVVLGLLRAALGTPALPPNSVIAALAIMLSALVMSPTAIRIQHQAYEPYAAHKLSMSAALARGASELERFMLR
ncbi:MAG: flagellar biosynthetic protein FliP, partial [Candidatus Eremiobacteraeota bacterium]|nr:flagellar biosynthetic protein FliP [Candidatus Eremiobacteraeota bacterium]